MRFKIDENVHPEVAALLRENGHDAVTIWDQSMRGSVDERVADVCRAEQRALLTLDLDFSDVRRYPPREYHGLVVLRVRDQSRRRVVAAVSAILPMIGKEQLEGRLWIVEEVRVRIRGE